MIYIFVKLLKLQYLPFSNFLTSKIIVIGCIETFKNETDIIFL